MKYIDAERLKAEIEKRMHICDDVFERDSDTYYQGKAVAYQETLSFIDSLQQDQSEIFDTVAFQKGVQEGRRLEREDVKSTIQSRIDEILGDAQPNPILRMELQELIKKIEA